MFIANEKDIKEGLTTDVYFVRTEEILRKKGIDNYVVADFTVQWLKYPWGVFVGLPEVIEVLEGRHISLYALPEGSIFKSRDEKGFPVPVMVIEGPYLEFARFETPLLGFICEASGIATKTARLRKIAKDKTILSFGIRRMHPAIAPMIDRSAYIGGCDGVSSLIGAKTIGKSPTGTIPHALIINMDGIVKAVKAFDEIIDPSVPRLALVDTFQDEKFESLLAAETLGKKLYGVRLDTPGSRRGSIVDIAREVRWELDLRGFNRVKILVSGGLDEESVRALTESGVVDGFGVGTAISNADTIDFAMDIVEVNGKPIAKRGKYSGRKKVYRRFENGRVLYEVKKFDESILGEDMLVPVILDGKVVYKERTIDEIRNYVLEQLSKIEEL
uniref:nicotinate phosphoribosyltransferase n=1 Tax=Caldisericum exile TaxID=693075 RepID=A0A7C4Y069_9BACT